MEEWKEYKLGDCVEAVIDNRGKSAPTKPLGEFPLLEINSIGGYYPNYSVIRKYVDKVTYNTWFRSGHPICGDILIPTVGTIGIISIMDNHKACIAQNLIALRTKKEISNIFIYYFLKSPIVKKQLINLDIGGVQPSIKVPHLLNLSISLPEKDIQHKIASILSSLDDKIEVNRKINDNLEQQAQALFKSWFVDFEPFKDQPFVDSELGMIPQGWRVCRADEVFDINIGKTPPRKEPEWFTKNTSDNIWVSIADMGSCGMFVSESSEYLTNEAINRFNILMVDEGSVLLSFKLTVGRVAIADTRLTTNEAIARFQLPQSYYREFLYLYLKQYKYGNLGSTSSIATAVNSKTIKGMKLITPPEDVISCFSKHTKPLFDKIKVLSQESRCLAELRDTLLPRLMSGELRVTDMDLVNKLMENNIF